MAMFYPRRQTVIIFLICAISVGAAGYYVFSENRSATTAQEASVSAASGPMDMTSKIDNPLLANWQDDFGTSTVRKPNQKAAPSNEKLTQTDKFGRDFFSRYVDLKQANLLGNQDVVNQTASDLVTSNVSPTIPKTYTVADLKIVPSSGPAALQTFSSAVAAVMESYNITKNEQSIMSDFSTSNDPAVLKGLTPIISTYKRMISSLLAVRTPQSVAVQELELINALSAMQSAATDMQASGDDTVRGLAGASAHVNAISSMITALTDLHSALSGMGVSFDFDQSVLNTMLG